MNETRTWHDEDGDVFHEFDLEAGGRLVASPTRDGGIWLSVSGSTLLSADEIEELTRLLLKVALS